MTTVGIEHEPITHGLFEFFDGFSIDQDIVSVVHDMHFGIAAQTVEGMRQRAALDKAFQVGLGLSGLLPPCRVTTGTPVRP